MAEASPVSKLVLRGAPLGRPDPAAAVRHLMAVGGRGGDMKAALAGVVPGGWETITLGDLCALGGGDIQTGPFGTELHAADYVPDGVPSVMPRNIGDNVIHTDGIARVAATDAERLEKYTLRPGDIVYSRRGDVERRALVRPAQDGWLCGTGCLRIRPGTAISARFLAHYLGHPAVRRWVVGHAVGVTMRNLNTAILGALPVAVPSRPTQSAIADVLDALERKIVAGGRLAAAAIELGTARFALEAAEDACATATLGDAVDLAYGRALKDADRRPGPVPVYGSNGRIGYHDTALVPGPGVIVGRKGNAGAVSWAPEAHWPIDTAFAVRPRDLARSPEFLFFLLRSLGLPRLAADSAVPGLSRSTALSLPVRLPPAASIERITLAVGPLLRLVGQVERESRVLAELRDTLLPGLISGEVRVRDATATAAGVA